MKSYEHTEREIGKGEKVIFESYLSDKVKVIPLKDGTFALSVDVGYIDGREHSRETCRIKINDEGVPYVLVDGGHDFTEDNCGLPIESFKYRGHQEGYNHTVDGAYPVMTLREGGIVPEKSVFAYRDGGMNENVKKWFTGYYYTAWFNNEAIAELVKYVENPENAEVLRNRLKRPTEQEKSEINDAVRGALEQYMAGKIRDYDIIGIINQYEHFINENGLNPEGVIEIDFDQLVKGKQQGE